MTTVIRSGPFSNRSSFMIGGPIRFSIWKSYQSFILFRQFALYLVNAASILWPESELDTAIQHLFDKYLNKTPSNDNGILLSDECRDFIPHFFVIWENCECKMTARHDFHIYPWFEDCWCTLWCALGTEWWIADLIPKNPKSLNLKNFNHVF